MQALIYESKLSFVRPYLGDKKLPCSINEFAHMDQVSFAKLFVALLSQRYLTQKEFALGEQ